MKKNKMILAALALVVGVGSAFAFTSKALETPNLYTGVPGNCTLADCSTFRLTPQTPACDIPLSQLYTSSDCINHPTQAWVNE